jgi:hypothetical protein
MLRVNVYEFYRIGAAIHPLKSIKLDKPLALEESYIYQLVDAKNAAAELLAPGAASLRTARTFAGQLITAIEAILDCDCETKVPRSRQSDLYNSVMTLEAVLAAELASQDLYSISKKGIYDTAGLIDSGESILPEKLRAYLPTQAIIDLRQGGRCLAFEIPTGAAFHLLRAAESVIKAYYEALAGKPWPHLKRDWGEYVRELKTLNAPERVTTALDLVRSNYRNPLMHPEANLDLDEALGLFGMVQGLLCVVLQEITGKT